MAEIRKLFWLRHLRAEAASHILRYRGGALERSGRGLAFWFYPMVTAVAEVPVDDRDLNYQFKGRTRDHQEVTVLGVITYRVIEAERVASRVDFAIDLDSGRHVHQPLEQLSVLLTGIAQQAGLTVIAKSTLAELMQSGFERLVAALQAALRDSETLRRLGVSVETTRLDAIRPSAELERALQTPTREHLQQQADEAMFQRRALAVEKERAIAENELQTQVELASREEALIAQQGANARQRVETENEATRLGIVAAADHQRIEVEAEAQRQRVQAEAQAARQRVLAEAENQTERGRAQLAAECQEMEGKAAAARRREESYAQAEAVRVLGLAQAETIRAEGLAEADKERAIGEARAAGEQERLKAYRDLPAQAVMALALQELAGQLKIDNLTVTPDMLGGLLEKAARLGVARLEGE